MWLSLKKNALGNFSSLLQDILFLFLLSPQDFCLLLFASRRKIGKILLVLSSQGTIVEWFYCYPSPSGRMRSDAPFS